MTESIVLQPLNHDDFEILMIGSGCPKYFSHGQTSSNDLHRFFELSSCCAPEDQIEEKNSVN